jgi:anti-sigma factor RsiW
MSTHATTETLSAYLDRQLSAAQTREIEDHLADCPRCRRQFAGMRSVVASLRHLERMAPPPTLGGLVTRRVTLESARKGLLDRFESGLGLFERQSSILGLFGLIVALAVIMLLFAQALERQRNASIPVIFHDPTAARGESRELAGRVFRRESGVWVEAGLEAEPDRAVAADSRQWRALVAAHPELAELETLEEAVVLRVEDGVLRREALAAGTADPRGSGRPLGR